MGAGSLLRAVVLGILHGPLTKGAPSYLSNQMPRTYATKPDAAVKYWTARRMKPPRVPVLDTVLRRIAYALAIVPPIPVPGEIRHGDARQVLPRLRRRFDWVVTSPPYFGMYSYIPDQWLRNWFLGGPPAVDYDASLQISQGGLAGFTTGLATVWRWTAARQAEQFTEAGDYAREIDCVAVLPRWHPRPPEGPGQHPSSRNPRTSSAKVLSW